MRVPRVTRGELPSYLPGSRDGRLGRAHDGGGGLECLRVEIHPRPTNCAQQPPPALDARTAEPTELRRADDEGRPTDGGRRLKPWCQRKRGNSNSTWR